MPGPMTCLPSLHISLLTSETYMYDCALPTISESAGGILTVRLLFLLGTPNELPPTTCFSELTFHSLLCCLVSLL